MLRRLASATLVLFFACDDGPACVIDTDCAGFDICLDNVCVPRGGPLDAEVTDGPRDEDGGPVDAGSDMGPEPGSLGTGAVSLLSVPAGADPAANPGSYTVSAVFVPAGVGPTCTTTTVEGCTVVDCEAPMPATDAGVPDDAGTPEPMPVPHAGTIQVSGGTMAVSLEPDATMGTYPAATGTMPLFMVGTELVVTAPGDEVPMFRSSDLQGVNQLTVTAPVLPDSGALTFDSTTDLALTWADADSGPADGVVRVQITSISLADGTFAATCDFPVADGSGTVPGELFAMVPDGRTTRIRVTNQDRETLDRAGWLIEVEAWARVRAATVSGPSRNFDVPLAFSDRPAP